MSKITLGFVFCALIATSALGQANVGDWSFKVENGGTSREKRIASTPAQSFHNGEPTATLALGRPAPDSPMDLSVSIAPGEEAQECVYSDWQIAVDSTSIPVKSFSNSPSSAILVAGKGISEDDLWTPFRRGLKMVVFVSQNCEGLFGKKQVQTHVFSLRGSAAAFNFVIDRESDK